MRAIMDIREALGRRIKNLRGMRGYSQEQLSEIMGISQNYLRNIERGKENPTLELFIKLSQGLKVGMHEIFTTETHEEPKLLRKKMRELTNEIKDPELNRILRVLETLVH